MSVTVDFKLDTSKIKKNLNDPQNLKALDSIVIRRLRLNMPYDSHTMQNNTREVHAGLIEIATPYAHRQNEGKNYFYPKGKSKGSGVTKGKMNYDKWGGTNRGPHFVERTINGEKEEIIKEFKNYLKEKNNMN